MGSLFIVVGNSGVGKTTFTRALAIAGGFVMGVEEHAERPFQALFKKDRSYALANQVDYLLLRAEQEREIRETSKTGIQDGGLEMDWFVFTHLFLQKGLLTDKEFQICARLYRQLRLYQPAPEGIFWLAAPLKVIESRFSRRGRKLEITTSDDLHIAGALFEEWISKAEPERVMRIDASREDPTYAWCMEDALRFVGEKT